MAENACSISSDVVTSNAWIENPAAFAALSIATMAGLENASRGSSTMATRASFGTISLNSANRLPERSRTISESPVTLPPGRARLSTSPLPTGSGSATMTMGMVPVARLASPGAKSGHRDDHIDFAFGKLLRQRAKPLRLFGRKTVVQLDVLAFDITKLAKRFGQGAQIFLFLLVFACVPQHADARHCFALLRLRGKRPRRSGAAEKRDEFASSHMTSLKSRCGSHRIIAA